MRINNKYLRNRAYKDKCWKRIRTKEHPFTTYMPYTLWDYPEKGPNPNDYENQVRHHFEYIIKKSRAIENGNHRGMFHATSLFRRLLNKQRKARERTVLHKIRNGDYDAIPPTFKKDADWLYF